MKIRGLYAITPEAESGDELRRKVALAIEGGIALLQYRRKARGSLEEARASYAAALAARPDDATALLNAGSVALDLGLIDEARSMYDRALQARPGYADALYGLARRRK